MSIISTKMFEPGYRKKIFKDGLITNDYHEEYNNSSSEITTKNFFYDQEKRVAKISFKIERSGLGEIGEIGEERFSYHKEGFTRTKIRTQVIHDYASNPDFNQGALLTPEDLENDFVRDDYKVLLIEECKTKDQKIIFKKVTDLQTNSTIETEYFYENNNLVKEDNFKFFNSSRYLSARVESKFDSQNNLINRMKFGRYNSELILREEENTEWIEENWKKISLTDITEIRDDNEDYFSYFDYDQMIKLLKSEYKPPRNLYSQANLKNEKERHKTYVYKKMYDEDNDVKNEWITEYDVRRMIYMKEVDSDNRVIKKTQLEIEELDYYIIFTEEFEYV